MPWRNQIILNYIYVCRLHTRNVNIQLLFGSLCYASYESGTEPMCDAWLQFRICYYMFALVFVVETIFLYPYAMSFDDLS
ncbi:hypothetical protein ACS0TY_015663 [Phlomoides rotata]